MIFKRSISHYYLAGLAASFAACSGPSEPKSNVIIILADDMGWGDLSINGKT